MIKLNPEVELERETPAVSQGRAICVGLKQGGIKVWLKGKREFFVIPYELVLLHAKRQDQRGFIPSRKVSDSKLEKAKAAIDANRPTPV